MEAGKNFDHKTAEAKWYTHWLEKKYFFSHPDEREPYTIVIPPPNVTGVLHMGHCLNHTIQDILIRRARMSGKNACWVPGTDHASIATEAKVVGMLREKGITKSSLSREQFLRYAWDWKEKYGGIILDQLKKLGCSLDWKRTTFTMDEHYYQSVMKVFVDLYNKGWIYRGQRMIHWDVKAKTALSDEEVIYKEVNSKLYFVRYKVLEEMSIGLHDYSPVSTGGIVIATVRPETILGDTAICVNPKDERYKDLIGKTALVPLINRRIPIIADDYVTMEFGTGALKVTPAHDVNDYQLGKKYNLDIIDVLNDDGTMSPAAQLFIGDDRFEARKKIVAELEAANHIVKIEDYTNQIGFSERSDAVVEPRLSLQWWVNMKKLSEPALKAVMDDAIKFYPSKFRNSYSYWMENIKDWCISRQLWWGQRIPAWYDQDGNVYVAENLEKLYNEKPETRDLKLTQDSDVLDTWFSSWLWPIEVFKGISQPGNADIRYYYPTQTLVTAPEIIFFWVARMIVSGFEYMREKPFSNVYFTGIVRDELGRKMSKQLGNSPDLLGLIDKYGADGVRFGIMISSPAGNDLLFDVKEESTLKQGSFFINKIWNAMKLVKMWEGKQVQFNANTSLNGPAGKGKADTGNFAGLWFETRLNEAKTEIEKLFQQFRLSEALKTIYSLIWDDFCSWYLEWIKPAFEQPIDAEIYESTVVFFEELMQLLHPFMPFVTEEIYHLLRAHEDDICIKQLSPVHDINTSILKEGELLKQVITTIRDARNKNNIKPKESIVLRIQTEDHSAYKTFGPILQKQVNADEISYTTENFSAAIIVAVERDKFFIRGGQETGTAARKEDLEKDLAYQKKFLSSVQKKLNNEQFMQNAKPEIVDMERKKQADAEARIKTIEESLQNLD
jgi:valyl-tRNA synthetase